MTPEQRNEECRREVLNHLATRSAVAHHPNAIRRALNAGERADWTDDEIAAACHYHQSAGHAEIHHHPHGSTKYYQATSAGILAHERTNV